eukprot:scaffold499352_cov14-Prasinocladus_malaysianus.AAC.1
MPPYSGHRSFKAGIWCQCFVFDVSGSGDQRPLFLSEQCEEFSIGIFSISIFFPQPSGCMNEKIVKHSFGRRGTYSCR